MQARLIRMAGIAAAGAVLLALPVVAQWKMAPGSGAPKKADGTPNLTAPAPKMPDGKPDLSGIWEQDNLDHFRNLTADMKAEEVPIRPEAKALRESRANGARATEEPDANCLPQGVPKIMAAPVPFKIVQTSNLIVHVYEAFNLWRQIHLDGRELIADPNPTWLGYSSGKWEGDTLVVDVRGLNGKAWLDTSGLPASDALHVTERWRRKDFGHMDLEITVDDPKIFTRPWTAKEPLHLVPGTELLEFICGENEKDLPHLVK
ncbi:MAG: hypothetical protein ABI811_07040 [Acidobacteriota bacterium]